MAVFVDCSSNLSMDFITEEYWNTGNISTSHRATGIALGTTMLVFFLLGVPGNALIIFSILRRHLYQQPTLLILLHMAMADLMACLIVILPTIVTGMKGEYILGGSDYVRCLVCQIGITVVLFSIVNLHFLALLSFDRFFLIKCPLKYGRIVTTRRTTLAVVVVWLVCIVMCVPPFFGFGSMYYDHPTFSCTPQFEGDSRLTRNIFYLMVLLVEGLVPLSVIIIANVWILVIAQTQVRRIYSIRRSTLSKQYLSESIQHNLKKEKNRKQLQLLRVFGSILISNMISWIPLIVRIIEASVTSSDNSSLWSNFILIISIHFHSIIHPFLQASLIPEIRGFLFTCKPLTRIEKDCHLNCLELLNSAILSPNELESATVT